MGDARTYYHGTDLRSAVRLLNGAPLDAAVAAAAKIDGPPGFFLATVESDADYFAARRSRGGVLRYNLSATAVARLTAAGAVPRPIPMTGDPPYFAGDEFYVPPSAFDLFNRLRASGEIVVVPAP